MDDPTQAPSSADEHTYLTGELCALLDITPRTLNKYAKIAGVKTPCSGQRNFRYTSSNAAQICTAIADSGSHHGMVKRAREKLIEIKG